MIEHTESSITKFVYNFIKEYEKWNVEIVGPLVDEKIRHRHGDAKGGKSKTIIEKEFDKRIGVMFIGPTTPRSYGGIYTKKGFASDRHGVDGEKVVSIKFLRKDEWMVETEYKYEVADVSFSHQYRYYIVSVNDRLRIGRIMIVDKGEIAGNAVYQEL